MMTGNATNTGRKVNERIARYLENPVGTSQRAMAVREVIMAKAKRKRSAAQIAATQRMLAAAAAKRAGREELEELEELEENPKMAKRAGKKAAKKTARKSARKSARKPARKSARRKAAAKRSAPKKPSKRKHKKSAVAAVAATPKKPSRRKRKKSMPAASAAAPKKHKRRSRTKRTQGKAHIVRLKGAPKVQHVEIVEKKRPKRRKRKAQLMENPMALAPVGGMGTFGGLFENPIGPLSKDSLVGFGWAAAGTAIGLAGARLTDRYVATMAPGKSKSGVEGKHPWYGRDAAAMINRRPGALRYGVQAGGALAGMIAAYAARNVRVLPWLFGGLALGYGSNLILLALEWAILPKILKGDPNKPETMTSGLGGIGNRLLPVEQEYVQDALDKQLEDWSSILDLAASQANEKPVAPSPLATPQSAYTLGESRGGPPGPLPQAVGGLIPTGRVGSCASCGGNGGCYQSCPEIQNCGPCANGGGGGERDSADRCEYTVQPGDDLQTLLDASGVTVSEIEALNGGRPIEQVWQEGAAVVLPYAACVEVVRRLPPPVRTRIPEREPQEPPPPPPPPPPPTPEREPTPTPSRPTPTFTLVPEAVKPSRPVPTFTLAPSAVKPYVPPTVAGAPWTDAEKERKLRGAGRNDD